MKVAILMPEAFDLGVIRQVRSLATALRAAAPLDGAPVSIVIGLPQRREDRWREKEQWLRQGQPDIIVRHTVWERIPAENAIRMFPAFNCTFELSGIREVVIPRDWGTNFTDCDVWISFADPGMGALYALRPTAHYCSDLSSRRWPETVALDIRAPYWQSQTDAFRLWRQGGLVITSDETTASDLTSYAGIIPDAIMTVPTLLDDHLEQLPLTRIRDPHRLMWRTEPTPAHDISNATEGLRLYLGEGGQLQPVICSETEPGAFGDSSNLPLIASLPPEIREMLGTLPAERVVSDARLTRLMAGSAAMWSSRVAGGGGAAFFESAQGQLPLAAYHTPAHARAARDSGAAVRFYADREPARIADALHKLEASLPTLRPDPRPTLPTGIKSLKYGFVLDRLLEMARD